MKTLLSVKVDNNIKAQAQKLAKDLGIPLSTVINANLREFIASKKLVLTAIPRLKPEIEKELALIEKDIKNNRNLSPIFSKPEEIDRHLDLK